MTLDELKERIKEEIVLHEGDVAEWEWRQKGLTAEAQQLGLSPADFSRLVNQVSYAVAPDFGRISELKARIITTAQKQQKQLYQSDIRSFVEEADRARLSRMFVTEKWIPAILATLPEPVVPPPAPVAPRPSLPVVPSPPPAEIDPAPSHPLAGEAPKEPPAQPSLTGMFAPEPKPKSESDSAPEPIKPAEPDLRPKIREEVKRYLDGYNKQIPANAIQTLFSLLDYDDQLVATEVRAYLTDNFYASVQTPQGSSLQAKLASTDWKHLSHWEQPKTLPAKPVLQPESARPAVPPKAEKSDAFIIMMAIGVVLVLIALTLWIVKGEKKEPAPVKSIKSKRTASVESYTPNRKETRLPEPVEVYDDIASDDRTANDESETTINSEEGRSGNGAYDEVVESASDSELRAARKGKKWGFIDANGNWVIKPAYESVGDFHSDRALVILNGKAILIGPDGSQIRE